MRRMLLLGGCLLLLMGCSGKPASDTTPYVYIVGAQGGMQVVDPASGQSVRQLKLHQQGQAALSADGGRLWLISPTEVTPVEAGTWKQEDSAGAKELAEYKLFMPYVSLSGDGRWLFATKREITGAGQDALWFEAFDTEKRAWRPGRLEPGCRSARPLAAPDGKQVYALCEGQISIIPREGGAATLVRLPGGQGLTTHFPGLAVAGAVAPDGTLYVGQRDGTISVVDPVAGKVVRSARPDLPEGWGLGLENLALSPDGKLLHLGVGDPLTQGKLEEIWTLSTADLQVVNQLKPPGPFMHLASAPADGKAVYVLGKGVLWVLDAESGAPLRKILANPATPAAYLLTAGRP